MRLLDRVIANLGLQDWFNGKINKRRKRMPCETTASTFSLVKFGTKMKAKQAKVREDFTKLEATLVTLKESREKHLAKTALEEAYTWASRAIRSEQLDRNARNR